MNKVDLINKKQLKKDLPDFKQGDTIQVHIKVKEDDKERIQVFEGIVLGVKGKGLAKSFTIRKISYGVGVERTFPLHSTNIKKIEVLKKGKAKRAKLFYLRNKSKKQFKVDEA
jgi:large subunit ribosomal protein L19